MTLTSLVAGTLLIIIIIAIIFQFYISTNVLKKSTILFQEEANSQLRLRITVRTKAFSLSTKTTNRKQPSKKYTYANQINILVADEIPLNRKLFGKIRSYGEPQPCKLINVNDREISVEFNRPQFAPCPGQRLVLYDEADNVVAGGTIISPDN